MKVPGSYLFENVKCHGAAPCAYRSKHYPADASRAERGDVEERIPRSVHGDSIISDPNGTLSNQGDRWRH